MCSDLIRNVFRLFRLFRLGYHHDPQKLVPKCNSIVGLSPRLFYCETYKTMRHVKQTIKGTTILALSVFILSKYRTGQTSVENAVEWLNSLETYTKDSFDASLEIASNSTLTYENMLISILQVIESFADDMSSPPIVLDDITENIVEAMRSRIDSQLSSLFLLLENNKKQLETKFFGAYFDKWFEEMDSEFKVLMQDISGPDEEQLSARYFEMSSTLKDSFVPNSLAAFIENTDARINKSKTLASMATDGALLSYERLVDVSKKILQNSMLTTQVPNYVSGVVQKHITNTLNRKVTKEVVESYASGTLEENDFQTFLNDNFQAADTIRTDVDNELVFRTEKQHIMVILKNQTTQTYLSNVETINLDETLSDDQKSGALLFAKKNYDEISSSLDLMPEEDLSIENLRELASAHLSAVLPKVRTYVFAIFEEIKNVLNRAHIEGKIVCITQFYEMRRILNYEFFFTLAQENDFDIPLTEAKFKLMFESASVAWRDIMPSVVRMTHVAFLYDDALRFLNSLSGLFFSTYADVGSTVDILAASIHESIADTVAIYIDNGIDDAFPNEKEESLRVINAVFEQFSGDMEIAKVSHQIEQIEELALAELSEKIQYANEILPELAYDYQTEVVSVFDDEWMAATQKSFISDDDIDYAGMKKYAVIEMNKVAEEKFDEYMTIIDYFLENQIIQTLQTALEQIMQNMSSVIESAPITDPRKSDAYTSLETAYSSITGKINSLTSNIRVNVDNMLREKIKNLDIIMDVNTQNFFDTTQRVLVVEFNEWATTHFIDIYSKFIQRVPVLQTQIANEGMVIFEQYARQIISYELLFRKDLEEIIESDMNQFSEFIVNGYTIISFNARRTILMNEIRNTVNVSGTGIRTTRTSILKQIDARYQTARLEFRAMYQKIATDEMALFQEEYSGAVTQAYERAADLLGMFGTTLESIAGPMRKLFTDYFNDLIVDAIYSQGNDLPEVIDFQTLAYPPGILSLADPIPNSLNSIVLPNLLLQRINDQNTGAEYDDEQSKVQDAASESLGTTYESIPYSDIVKAFTDLAAWEKNIVDVGFQLMAEAIDQELKNNTCVNKPECIDGGEDCASTSLVCRTGYTGPAYNIHGVLCCTFEPEVIGGFTAADIAWLFGIEIGISIGADKLMTWGGKGLKKAGEKLLGKGSSKSLTLVGKAAGKKVGAKVAKTGAKLSMKMALRTGLMNGMKVALAPLTAAVTFISKFGVKAAFKLAAKKAATKAAMKLLSLAAIGPIGWALILLDVFSLLLDVYDPQKYNEVQSAGQIRNLRDNLKNQWDSVLETHGINAPVLANTLYNIPPEERYKFQENLAMEWFTDNLATFLSANESRWELMPASEVADEYNAEVERLSMIIDTDINFMERLVCENTENTFMVKASKVNGTDPLLVGTTRDEDYDSVTDTHLMMCSLTATGVIAANTFEVNKAKFINDLIEDPVYRWKKIASEGGYVIYEDLMESELEKVRVHVETMRNTLKSGGIISEEELNTPSVTRYGWAFVKMDPHEEFWRQYSYSKTEEFQTKTPDLPYSDRSNFIDAWKYYESEQETTYRNNIIANAITKLEEMTPDGHVVVTLDDVKNKTSDSPEWYPDYTSLMEEAKTATDTQINEYLAEEREKALIEEQLTAEINASTDELVASDSGVSIDEARNLRLKEEAKLLFEPVSPDFAIFQDGYAQISALYTVKQTCENMGYGVTFDENKGLCNFTKEYCTRYGLTFFYNKSIGTNDCRLAGGQRVAESIFGTTFTRGIKRGFFGGKQNVQTAWEVANSDTNSTLGSAKYPTIFQHSLGGVRESSSVVDMGFEEYMPSDIVQMNLQKLGLDTPYSIWN